VVEISFLVYCIFRLRKRFSIETLGKIGARFDEMISRPYQTEYWVVIPQPANQISEPASPALISFSRFISHFLTPIARYPWFHIPKCHPLVVNNNLVF